MNLIYTEPEPRAARRSFAPRFCGAGSLGLYIIGGIQPPVAPEVIKIEPLHDFFL